MKNHNSTAPQWGNRPCRFYFQPEFSENIVFFNAGNSSRQLMKIDLLCKLLSQKLITKKRQAFPSFCY